MNRAVSYFTEPNNEMNNSDREMSDDDEVVSYDNSRTYYALLADGHRFLSKFIILNAKDVMIAVC
jgi:hypothetical protein